MGMKPRHPPTFGAVMSWTADLTDEVMSYGCDTANMFDYRAVRVARALTYRSSLTDAHPNERREGILAVLAAIDAKGWTVVFSLLKRFGIHHLCPQCCYWMSERRIEIDGITVCRTCWKRITRGEVDTRFDLGVSILAVR